MKCTYITSKSFTELILFSHKVSFVINTVFPLVRETLYAGRVKFCAETLELLTHAVYSSEKRRLRSASFSGTKLWKSKGAKSGL